MDKDFLNLLDEVDASVFTGDSLEDEETLDTFEDFVDSWKREINNMRDNKNF